MKSFYYKLILESDCIFSESIATEGSHKTLPYIPGSALHGMAADQLLKGFSKEDKYTVFFSGKVQFSNAYPFYTNNAFIPIPFCYYLPKESGQEPKNKKELANFLNVDPRQLDGQYKQQREYFFSKGSYHSPLKNFYLKTAIDRKNFDSPKESQLFAYESLHKKNEFWFCLKVSDSISDSITNKLIELFSAKRTVYLGRSKSAEFGRVKIEPIQDFEPSILKAEPNSKELKIYALSDICLFDPISGLPTTIPSAKSLGIPDAELNQTKCFIKTRSYTPYNEFKRSHEIERLLIAAGSVITFSIGNDYPLQKAIEQLKQGIGIYKNQGFGQILVNPEFLFTDKIYLSLNNPEKAEKQTTPTSFIGKWLNGKDTEQQNKIGYENELHTVKRLLAQNIPTNNQWSNLRQIALHSKSFSDLYNALFHDKEGLFTHGVSKKQWDMPYSKKEETYSEYFKNFVDKNKNDFEKLRYILYRLGKLMPRQKEK